MPAWTGPLTAKRALPIFTSSYEERDFAAGRAGSVDAILYPLLWGTLAYTGMQVLRPYVAYAAYWVPGWQGGSVTSAQRAAFRRSDRGQAVWLAVTGS